MTLAVALLDDASDVLPLWTEVRVMDLRSCLLAHSGTFLLVPEAEAEDNETVDLADSEGEVDRLPVVVLRSKDLLAHSGTKGPVVEVGGVCGEDVLLGAAVGFWMDAGDDVRCFTTCFFFANFSCLAFFSASSCCLAWAIISWSMASSSCFLALAAAAASCFFRSWAMCLAILALRLVSFLFCLAKARSRRSVLACFSCSASQSKLLLLLMLRSERKRCMGDTKSRSSTTAVETVMAVISLGISAFSSLFSSATISSLSKKEFRTISTSREVSMMVSSPTTWRLGRMGDSFRCMRSFTAMELVVSKDRSLETRVLLMGSESNVTSFCCGKEVLSFSSLLRRRSVSMLALTLGC
mmetsp:Transcript_33163/g.80151  ORF Transcript_33163/g.80151 Transcript_33163/m.80151 type:complete len:353 (-) Transcript_33163:798-1856(-)